MWPDGMMSVRLQFRDISPNTKIIKNNTKTILCKESVYILIRENRRIYFNQPCCLEGAQNNWATWKTYCLICWTTLNWYSVFRFSWDDRHVGVNFTNAVSLSHLCSWNILPIFLQLGPMRFIDSPNWTWKYPYFAL